MVALNYYVVLDTSTKLNMHSIFICHATGVMVKSTERHVDHQHDEVSKLDSRHISHECMVM